jgi:hypothetical protein
VIGVGADDVDEELLGGIPGVGVHGGLDVVGDLGEVGGGLAVVCLGGDAGYGAGVGYHVCVYARSVGLRPVELGWSTVCCCVVWIYVAGQAVFLGVIVWCVVIEAGIRVKDKIPLVPPSNEVRELVSSYRLCRRQLEIFGSWHLWPIEYIEFHFQDLVYNT